MTPANTRLTAIKDALASTLPALLTAAGLDDFDEYVTGPPSDSNIKSLAVYLSEESDRTDFYYFLPLIQCQLYGVRNDADYHSVIFQALRDELTPQLVGLDYRSEIVADLWPINGNVSTSFIFYAIEFTAELDDCDS